MRKHNFTFLCLIYLQSDVQNARGAIGEGGNSGRQQHQKWTPREFPRKKLKLLNVIAEEHFGQVRHSFSNFLDFNFPRLRLVLFFQTTPLHINDPML